MRKEMLTQWGRSFKKASVWGKIKLLIALSKDPNFWTSVKLAYFLWRTNHNKKVIRGFFLYSMLCEPNDDK